MLLWTRANRLPTSIVRMERTRKNIPHSWAAPGKAMKNAVMNTEKAPIFGPVAKKAVTGVGAPW